MVKSPLRYPGGKSLAAKHIISKYIPEDIKRICSPFVGGGSIEIALAQAGVEVHAYDILEPLVTFWQNLLRYPESLADGVNTFLPLNAETYKLLQAHVNKSPWRAEVAVMFYVLNRCSFNGVGLMGGMSPRHPRFTASSIERLRSFKCPNLWVGHADFGASIANHAGDFLYCDPPYATNARIYGSSNDKFGHERLAKMLRARDGWVLSYNDCDAVRQLYSGYKMWPQQWAWGMKSDRRSNEVIITSHDVKVRDYAWLADPGLTPIILNK